MKNFLKIKKEELKYYKFDITNNKLRMEIIKNNTIII